LGVNVLYQFSGDFVGQSKSPVSKKIGKIHQYSYFATIYSEKKEETKIYQGNKASIGKKQHVNRTRSTYGDRSFFVGAARLWNELPQHFMPLEDKESFKRELKTWLFRKAYGE
jgi:hypothetical protein